MECEGNLRKAKQVYMVRCEEYEKAKTVACRAEEEGGGSTAKSLEKKKRLEEEARNKVLINNFILSLGPINAAALLHLTPYLCKSDANKKQSSEQWKGTENINVCVCVCRRMKQRPPTGHV